MDAIDVLRTKRDGGELTAEQIRWIIGSYTAGTVPHEQMSALLMAIFLLMMELAMSGIDSTVPVTSRNAYSSLSAGARSLPAAQMTAPTSRSWAR